MLSDKVANYFDGKVIWVTGASSGIGRALTIMLSELDCDLYISSRTKSGLEKTKQLCLHQNNVHILEGDLTNKATNQSICKSINNTSGHLNIAILNAGTCEYVDINAFDSALFHYLGGRQSDYSFCCPIHRF